MPSKCPLCKKAEEDLDHLLIHCPAVWGMWAALLSIPGFQWVCPYLLKEVLSGWSCFPIKKKTKMNKYKLPIKGKKTLCLGYVFQYL